jgi:branched-chain amino acid transport system permease protein
MQIIVNGLVTGAAIAILALAFQTVYLPTRVFFIGMAGVYAISPFIALSVVRAGGNQWIAGTASAVAAVIICVACEWLIHAPLERRRATGGVHLIASLGFSIIVVQIISIVWGNNTQVLRTDAVSVSHLGGVSVTAEQWLTLGLAATVIGALALFLKQSDMGLRLRALADNPVQFALHGHNVSYHRLLSFGLAGFLTSVASLVTAYDLGFTAYSGLNALLLAVVAVIIGGQSSFVGSVMGGLLVGVIRSLVAWYWSARWQELVTFALLGLVLLLLPQGLLGRKTRLEASQ